MSLNMEMHKYLFSKRFLTLSVLTIFLFSIPLLLIYGYYSDTIWLGFNFWRNFGFTLVFYAIAISIMTLSKVLIYKYQSLHRLTLVKFILWVAIQAGILLQAEWLHLLWQKPAAGRIGRQKAVEKLDAHIATADRCHKYRYPINTAFGIDGNLVSPFKAGLLPHILQHSNLPGQF